MENSAAIMIIVFVRNLGRAPLCLINTLLYNLGQLTSRKVKKIFLN